METGELWTCGVQNFTGYRHGGGHPKQLYETFVAQLDKLSDDTRVYPGHDYITNNLGFTLDREPDNTAAADLLADLEGTHDPGRAMVTTLAQEKKAFNTFFRLSNPTVIAKLREAFPDMPQRPAEEEVFLRLCELRNSW